MRILGIDPGVATIGFGVVNAEGTRLRMESYGTITTPAGLPLATRLLQIETDMEQLLRDVKPDEVSIEELFFSKNITTGIAVAHGRGVILCTIEKMQLPVYEYTPMQVKQAVVGYGLAEKRQMVDMTRPPAAAQGGAAPGRRGPTRWPLPSATRAAPRAFCGARIRK